MTGDRFVNTLMAQQAVGGREVEILARLGVDWRAGRPHIRCPYPGHDDRHPSWRWDEAKTRAFCSCAQGGDDIFGVIEKIKGLDFEGAKIFAVGAICRTDLIRTKNETDKQRHDAASLLNAPADRRDDTLPIAYLGHRLEIPVHQVPIPATPMVGLKALAYFDPAPPGSRAKPKLVGEFPCCVFGTLGPDGKTHAHRIYVAPGGAGKANLGTAPDGRPRDRKKSAKLSEGDRSTGRCVLWGDAGFAPHLMAFEGIESAAAAAFDFGPEIAAGEITVAAGISAAGIAGLKLYAATKRVTIGADRDEAANADGKPGSRAGEVAARRFALRNYETVEVRIALPGHPGEEVDWLDILRRDGAGAVRAGLTAATLFVPTQAELDDQARAHSRAAELRTMAAAYPLPTLQSLRLAYMCTPAGEPWVHLFVGMDTAGNEKWVPVTTPFGITTRLRHVDQADAYGLRAVVCDMAGKPRPVDFDRAQLTRMSGAEIRCAFLANGLRVEKDGEAIAIAAIKAAKPEREIIVVHRTGWHEIDGQPNPIFITPGGEVIGAAEGDDLELASDVRVGPTVAKGGTMEGWLRASDAALTAVGCPHWKISVAAGFVGPLLDLMSLDACGIDMSGFTSQGKTFGQRLAVSVWSAPDSRKRGSLLQSMLATENSMEALAQRASGTVLALDDLAHASGQVVGRVIYGIASGTGKGRLDANAEMRDRRVWRTFAFLSSEYGLEEKVKSNGAQWSPGMAVRIADINIDGVNKNVDPDTLEVIGQIGQHFGHAGPAFIRALVEHGMHREGVRLRQTIMQTARQIAGGEHHWDDAPDGQSGNSPDSAAIRAAIPFALILTAGELAKTFDLISPTADIKDAVLWAWERFQRSPDASALNPDAKAIDAIRVWIAERWNVTLKCVNAESGNNREAVAWYDDHAIYIPKARLREAAGNNLQDSQVASILERHGLLIKRTEKDRLYVRYVPKVGPMKAYALSRSEFGRDRARKNGD